MLISLNLSVSQPAHYTRRPRMRVSCAFFFSKFFSFPCNKTVHSCINLMNGWKESCSGKENKAKPITNQTIYEILWCITLYHTRCVFFSGHGHFQKTLKKLPHTNLVCGSLLILVFFIFICYFIPEISIFYAAIVWSENRILSSLELFFIIIPDLPHNWEQENHCN